MNAAGAQRKALVSRHNVVYTGSTEKADRAASPLSLGNGAFCFTADYTGLQTFAGDCAEKGFPLCTMADWAWHSYPGAVSPEAVKLEPFDTYGRTVGYPSSDRGQEAAFKSARESPHRFSLARIAFTAAAGTPFAFDDFSAKTQILDLYTASLKSVFCVASAEVTVETFAAPTSDTLCVRASGSPLASGELAVQLAFGYPSHTKAAADFGPSAGEGAGRSELQINTVGPAAASFTRIIDSLGYGVTITHDLPFKSLTVKGDHTVTILAQGSVIDLAITFTPALPSPDAKEVILSFKDLKPLAEAWWSDFWQTGAVIDFAAAKAPPGVDFAELERRLILSRYLTAIQSRGSLPPAETGLTMNSWYGKYHLEMYPYHIAHFALWGRTAEIRRALDFYRRILPVARSIASSQGYKGARWPKMCGPDAANTPSPIAPLLVWQQPHPLFFAELGCALFTDERSASSFLADFREVIAETASFMLDFIHYDEAGNGGTGRYVLGPPLQLCQERFDPRSAVNPVYEVEYFRYGFRAANRLLARLGEEPREDFERAARLLASPAVETVEGKTVYAAQENCPAPFTEFPCNTDHPAMLCALGVVPGAASRGASAVDGAVMSDTLDAVLAHWDFPSMWGWDFPVMAMCAWALGRRDDALRCLLMDSPKNTYAPNGHNTQKGSDALPVYLPGNGGTLMATAFMAEGLAADYGAQIEGFVKYPEGV